VFLIVARVGGDYSINSALFISLVKRHNCPLDRGPGGPHNEPSQHGGLKIQPFGLSDGSQSLILKNGVFWDITSCGSKNRRFEGI
jgi:hypothetical protein